MPVRVDYFTFSAKNYTWFDHIRLASMEDKSLGISYEFLYGAAFAPEQVILFGNAEIIAALTGIKTRKLLLRIGVDQVNSIRALVTTNNIPIKLIEYDSFGNVIIDTNPKLQFPLGFACGLANCIPGGLIRFGYRDYHPSTGRFTCKDPLGDTGGDHDPYDYCVDDPISKFDPTGLIGMSVWTESEHPRDNIGRFAKKYNEGFGVNGVPSTFMEIFVAANAGTVSDQGGGSGKKHTGRELSSEEGKKVVEEAKKWLGTIYADDDNKGYEGDKAQLGKGGDCSGSTWKIYNELGFNYKYQATEDFKGHAEESGAFKQVDKPQLGDIGYWNKHVAIYAGEDNSGQPQVLTTSSSKEKKYKYTKVSHMEINRGGNTKWYRYQHIR